MSSWRFLNRDGVRLACGDFGGKAGPVLLLHGRAGHAGEWSETACAGDAGAAALAVLRSAGYHGSEEFCRLLR
jgi:pimeloyl-ACP methyl ester carboxylesterase